MPSPACGVRLCYLNVDEDIVWDSVTQELQLLTEKLKEIFPSESI
jgi:uncharacterized protein with HEPN domain